MEQKWWLNSTTVRGILVAVLPTIALVLKAFGIEFQSEQMNSITDGIVAVVGMIGTIYAIVGRVKADKPLGLKRNQT